MFTGGGGGGGGTNNLANGNEDRKQKTQTT